MTKFRFLSGDINYKDYGGKWISGKLNNGEFDYWIIIEVINWLDAVGEKEAPAKYNVSVSVVSPSEAGIENLERAKQYCGVEDEELSDEHKVKLLHSYGVFTQVWCENGNNYEKLMKEAHRFVNTELYILFSFVMDRGVNRIGTTGWEALKGDYSSAMNRLSSGN